MAKDVPNGLESLVAEVQQLNTLAADQQKKTDEAYRALKTEVDGQKASNKDLADKADRIIKDLAASTAIAQAAKDTADYLKKQADAPVHRTGADRRDANRAIAIDIQREQHKWQGGTDDTFRVNEDKLVNVDHLRQGLTKLSRYGGIETRAAVMQKMSPEERHALDAASIDSAYFAPQMLGFTLDCNTECAGLLDLYDTIRVNRSRLQYPTVKDYGAIGGWACPAECDATTGPAGNIGMANAQTFDWRGTICISVEQLREMDFDIFAFHMLAIDRSWRINWNRAVMVGNADGKGTEPTGWAVQGCFPKAKTPLRILSGAAGATPKPSFNHVDLRRLLTSVPQEHGPTQAVMHQNVFAYLASQTDYTGRFVFGDGLMDYTPTMVNKTIRISNCLPDATAGGTKGDDANPFTPGDFLVAVGAWKQAVKVFQQMDMRVQQHIGGSSMWCQKWQFGAKAGAQVHCCDAARELVVG